jgi:hypothetical protein
MPFFLSAGALSSDEKIRPRLGSGYGTMKNKFFFGPRGAIQKNDGCFSRIYGIPFGEKRSRLEPEDQRLFGTQRLRTLERFLQDQRPTVKKHAAVDVLFEKEGSPCGSGYPVVRGLNWEGG